MKPKNKLVELDYILNAKSDFYCRKNEANVIRNWASSSSKEKINSIDRLTLSSINTTLGDNYKRFAVGILTSNGIQLSPLNAIFQLRPDFDVTSSNLAQQSTTLDDDDGDDDNEFIFHKQSHSHGDDPTTDEETNEKHSSELVTMKFWRPEGRLQREKKMRSYNYFERARNQERWIDFAYYSSNELQAIELRNKWTLTDSNERNRLPIRWRKTTSIQDYFQLLFFNKQIILDSSIEEGNDLIESNVTTEQKSLIIPATKPKKKKKIDQDKATRKLSRKSIVKRKQATFTKICRTERKSIY